MGLNPFLSLVPVLCPGEARSEGDGGVWEAKGQGPSKPRNFLRSAVMSSVVQAQQGLRRVSELHLTQTHAHQTLAINPGPLEDQVKHHTDPKQSSVQPREATVLPAILPG